jgi:hypothetical protein
MTAARERSNVVLALLAAGVLHWVLELSADDRGPVDGMVIALVSFAIVWNVLQVWRRVSHLGARTA